MKAINKSGKEINLGSLKTSKAFKLLNEENFEKVNDGNYLDSKGAYYEDFKVGKTHLRKVYPTFLDSGYIEDLNTPSI